MRLLMVCTTCPVPPHGGAALRELGWLRTAAELAEVGLVTLTRNCRERKALEELGGVCSRLEAVRAPRSPLRKLADLCVAGLTGVPYVVLSGRETRMVWKVARLVEQWSPDVVQAELLPATPYLRIARGRGAATVYSAHNVESRIAAGAGGRAGRRRTRAMERCEVAAARDADAVVAVTPREAEWFRSCASRVALVPNAVAPESVRYLDPSARRGGSLLFLGRLDYGPNVDAAVELVREVVPRVRRELPTARCVVAGARPRRAVRALAGDGVEIVVDPPDAGPLFAEAAALVCPVRWGGGSRLKVLEAAARGVPVVSTGFGIEGLCLEPEVSVAVAEDGEGLARRVVGLLRDPSRADDLARGARHAVERHHAWSGLRSAMMELYAGVAGDHRARRGRVGA